MIRNDWYWRFFAIVEAKNAARSDVRIADQIAIRSFVLGPTLPKIGKQLFIDSSNGRAFWQWSIYLYRRNCSFQTCRARAAKSALQGVSNLNLFSICHHRKPTTNERLYYLSRNSTSIFVAIIKYVLLTTGPKIHPLLNLQTSDLKKRCHHKCIFIRNMINA